jgi:hypothetical protein
LLFPDDREDFDRPVFDVIEHPYFIDPEPELGSAHAPKTLDPARAQLARLVPKVTLDSVPHPGPNVCRKGSQFLHSVWRKKDLEAHSGYNLASFAGAAQVPDADLKRPRSGTGHDPRQAA